MSLSPFKDTEEFLTRFDLSFHPPYENITHLIDCKVGFSVQRQYPDNLLFKPARTPSGRDDTVALVHIIYRHPDEKKVDLRSVPITLRVNPHSRYFSKHFKLDYSDSDSPTKESLEVSEKSVKPLSMDFEEEIVYDHGADAFRHVPTGVPLTGRQILDYVFELHCRTAHWFWGIPVRLRLRIRNLAAVSCERLEAFLLTLLRLFCGQTISKEHLAILEPKPYKLENLKSSSDRLTFKGVPVTLNSIFSSALVVILGYIGVEAFDLNDTWLGHAYSNVLIVTLFFVILLILVDRGIPRLIVPTLNALNRLTFRVRFPTLFE